MTAPLDDDEELIPINIQDSMDRYKNTAIEEDDDELIPISSGSEDDEPLKNESWSDYVNRVGKDVAIQFAKGTASGLGGAYGNIANLLGLDSGENLLPGQKIRTGAQFDILEKMNQGEAPSFSDLMMLGDDDVAPEFSRLPTGRDIEDLIDPFIGQPETKEGRYAKRGGDLFGGGLAFGITAPLPPAAAALAGQTVEEAGGGPGMQLISELAALILTQGRSGNVLGKDPASKQRVSALRALGYTDEEITVGVNAAKENMSRSRLAKRTANVEKTFESVAEKGERLTDKILAEAFPGIEEGTKSVHSAASEIYADVVKAAKKVPVKNPKTFLEKGTEILDKFQNSIEALPGSQQSQLISSIKEGLKKLKAKTETKTFDVFGPGAEAGTRVSQTEIVGYPNAGELIELYKRFNQLGKWVGRDMKDRYLGELKTAVKETIGEQNKGLLDNFEEANKAVRKAYQAEEVADLIEKVTKSEGGLDYKKMKRMVDNPKNRKILERNLGETQAKNLYQIAKIGKEVGNFAEKFGTLNTNWLQFGMATAKLGTAGYGLFTGDWKPLIGTLGVRAAHAITTRLATQSLTNPRLQNIHIRGLNAIKTGSQKEFNRAMDQLGKYLKDEGLDLQEDELIKINL